MYNEPNMKRYLAILTLKRVLIAGAAIVVLGGGYALFSGSGEEEVKTITVHPAPFAQQVAVSGKVTPAREVDLGFTASGRIARVNVSVGSRVGAGTVLASLDSADLAANVQQREAALDTQKARLAALQTGPRPEEVAVAQAAVDNAQLALEQANQPVIDAIRDAYIKSDDAVRNQVYQFIENPRSANPRLTFTTTRYEAEVNLKAGVVAAESMLPTWQTQANALSSTGDLSAGITTAQSNIAKISAILTDATTVLNGAVADQNATQATIASYVSDISSARASISAASSALTSAITARKNAAAALDNAKKNLTLKQVGTAQADIDAQKAQIKSAEADLANARAQLSKNVIVAPFAGVITTVDAKAGAIASLSAPAISMIGQGTLQIESFVPEVNIALISVGNRATVTLDAYGEEVPFTARVVSIDPAETVKDGVPTYRALLQFEKTDERIKTGMTANVTITTLEKKDVIAVPQGVIVEREGKKFVPTLQGQTIVEREVTTGALSSTGEIEILTGLQDGDIVVLP